MKSICFMTILFCTIFYATSLPSKVLNHKFDSKQTFNNWFWNIEKHKDKANYFKATQNCRERTNGQIAVLHHHRKFQKIKKLIKWTDSK